MKEQCTLQLHVESGWRDVASVALFGLERDGWKAKTYTGYETSWALEHARARDAHALCARWPVGLSPLELDHWPVFLIDLLPQGFGRQELLRRLQQPPTAGPGADWKLLLAGAGNPIGHLRVKEAAAWLDEHRGPRQGFRDEDVAARGPEFAEFLASHGLFVAGSSGVQGEWPKLLLTRADDGLLYLDHTLPDDRAREHYLVKFGRGSDPQLASILRHEAPYMAIAERLGLRVHAPLVLRDRALFIPRFDRVCGNGRVTRLAQESIATLSGIPGIDAVPSHDEVCAALIRYCTDPQVEVLEYLKRDVANLALLNKDNHARNTAVQRDFEGRIALTPVYDFAPMYLHPDGIARRIRWGHNDYDRVRWDRVIERVGELAAIDAKARRRRKPVLTREPLVEGLNAMAPALREVAETGVAIGLDPEVAAFLRPGLLAIADELEHLV